MNSSYNIGQDGETLALNHFLGLGYSLITRNFEYRSSHVRGRLGEIDLIMVGGGKLHLVEVKARNNFQTGNGLESITKSKLDLLYKTFQYFLSKKEYRIYQNYFAQFDIAIVNGSNIEIIPNAYSFDR